MSEEIRKIVNMLSDGRINDDEAVRLLEAATKTAPAEQGGAMYSQDAPLEEESEDKSACHRSLSGRRVPRWRKVALLVGVLFIIAVSCVKAFGSRMSLGVLVIMIMNIAIWMAISHFVEGWRSGANCRHDEAG